MDEPAQTAAQESVVDSVWQLIAGAFGAFAGWAADHWADIGMGAVAVIMVMACTAAMKYPIDWVLKRKPVEDDTHKLIVRGIALVWSAVWSMALGFGKHFGSAIGVELQWYVALPGGTALTLAAVLGIWHGRKWFGGWITGDSQGAQTVRRVGRVWFLRLVRVTPEEAEEHATEKQTPEQMAELRKKLAEGEK